MLNFGIYGEKGESFFVIRVCTYMHTHMYTCIIKLKIDNLFPCSNFTFFKLCKSVLFDYGAIKC